jgi:hypothetical protein
MEDPLSVRGGSGHEEAIVRQTRRRPIIEYESILAQHHAVTRPPDRQGRKGVDVESI